jgi:hypothetical protein
MGEDSLYAKRCKANRGDSFFEEQIPNTPFCCKTQKYEPLHNSQYGVFRQIDVPLQKDASYTNSIQKDFPMQKNFHIHNPIQTHFPIQTNLLSSQAEEIEAGSKFCAYKILTIAESSVFLEIRYLHNYLFKKIWVYQKIFPKAKLILHLQNYSICKPTISKKIRPKYKYEHLHNYQDEVSIKKMLFLGFTSRLYS